MVTVVPQVAVRVDLSSGDVTMLGSQSSSADRTVHLSVDPTGRWLFCVSTVARMVEVFPIEPEGGVSPSVFSTVLQRNPTAVVAGPGGDVVYVLVANADDSAIHAYSVDADTGALERTSIFGFPTGTAPSRMAFSTDGRHGYVTVGWRMHI
jgi:6-phosphogluconolactonase